MFDRLPSCASGEAGLEYLNSLSHQGFSQNAPHRALEKESHVATTNDFNPFAPGDPLETVLKWDKTKVWRKLDGVKCSQTISFRTTEHQENIINSILVRFKDRYHGDRSILLRTAVLLLAHNEAELAKNPSPEYLAEVAAFDMVVKSDNLQRERDRHEDVISRVKKNIQDARGSIEEKIDAVIDCEDLIGSLTYPRFIRDARRLMEDEGLL